MTARVAFTVADTAIVRCCIAWGERGVVGFQLPESREAETRARVLRRFPEAQEASPSGEIEHAVEDIVALLRGELRDLSAIPLDMERVPPFNRRVYEVARTI